MNDVTVQTRALEENPDKVAEIWFIIAGRIAPELCSKNPGAVHTLFRRALREVSRKDGDIELAIDILHDIVSIVPPEWMVFDQAGQLLNVIGWRNRYHPGWFNPDIKRNKMRPGRCGPHVAHAYALMQAAVDEEALDLTSRILNEGEENSDDIHMACLIRAAIFICQGDIESGEEEFLKIVSLTG